MLKIGLTGGIGSGKSTAARLFAELGVEIIDADQIGYELTLPKQPAYQKIVKRFGPQILKADKTLDRIQLRKVIFTKEQERNWLEATLHPIIIKKMQRKIQSASPPYCIAVIPLLIETDLMSLFDRILVIDIDEPVQIKRASQRDHTEHTQIKKILLTQCSREQRLKHANDIIKNNGNLDLLYQQVQKLHTFYCQLTE